MAKSTSRAWKVSIPDLRVRPFFAHGGTMSIREFVIGALNNEMGLQALDPEVTSAADGWHCVTPRGYGPQRQTRYVEIPPDADPTQVPQGQPARNQIATSVVDYLEFYLLNYFKPGLYEQTDQTAAGRAAFDRIGCASCHIADLQIDRDRRVADVETEFNAEKGGLNGLFATATPLVEGRRRWYWVAAAQSRSDAALSR